MYRVTTRLLAPGERGVYVDGKYVGLITREPEGWAWTGSLRTFRTFTEAAHYVAERKGLV